MRLAQIEDDRVTNVIEVDPQNIPSWAADWPEAGPAGPGWLYEGGVFTPPPTPPAPVPATITPLQARTKLRREGKLPEVEAALASAPEETKDAWEYALEFKRSSPTIAAIASALGWSEEYVDDLFRDASEIEF